MEEQIQVEKKSKAWIWVLIIVLVLIVAGVIWFVMSGDGGSSFIGGGASTSQPPALPSS
jgi:flagellar basal body-associated protein FliL